MAAHCTLGIIPTGEKKSNAKMIKCSASAGGSIPWEPALLRLAEQRQTALPFGSLFSLRQYSRWRKETASAIAPISPSSGSVLGHGRRDAHGPKNRKSTLPLGAGSMRFQKENGGESRSRQQAKIGSSPLSARRPLPACGQGQGRHPAAKTRPGGDGPKVLKLQWQHLQFRQFA